jgi:acid phosphatase family membrane protein YuiD
MFEFVSFVTSYFFIAVVLAWLSSVLLKWIINLFTGEKNSLSGAFANGGMPSSHSALVGSLAAAVYITEGLSTTFYLSLMVAIIVMSDAFRVRKNLGVQGDSLNRLLVRLKQNPIKVVHGHSVSQVFAGAIWGVVVAILVSLVI